MILSKKSQKTPVYWGGNLALNPKISDEILNSFVNKKNYPTEIKNFIKKQKKINYTKKDEILIENFPSVMVNIFVFLTFMGKQTNQTFLKYLLII